MAHCRGSTPSTGGVSEAGLLGTVERYFAEIMPIPRLQQRIDCFIFTRSFEPAMQRVSTRVLCNPVNPVLYHEARLFLIIICRPRARQAQCPWSVYCFRARHKDVKGSAACYCDISTGVYGGGTSW